MAAFSPKELWSYHSSDRLRLYIYYLYFTDLGIAQHSSSKKIHVLRVDTINSENIAATTKSSRGPA